MLLQGFLGFSGLLGRALTGKRVGGLGDQVHAIQTKLIPGRMACWASVALCLATPAPGATTRCDSDKTLGLGVHDRGLRFLCTGAPNLDRTTRLWLPGASHLSYTSTSPLKQKKQLRALPLFEAFLLCAGILQRAASLPTQDFFFPLSMLVVRTP